MKIDIANVLVDSITTEETISRIGEFVESGKPHYIVTTYSEFVVFANRDKSYLEVLNKADLSLPDGSGILWAAKFLSLNAPGGYGALVNLVKTGTSLVFNPDYVKYPIREKVSGSKLIWDMAKLASEKNYSMAMVGGTDSVAAQSAEALKARFPGLKVNLAISGGQPFDEKTTQEISQSNSDILCLAGSPPNQEKWIAQNLSRLNVKVAIGLGGTFDYLAGKRGYPPKWMISLGLEWLWRLITQPYRIKRIWNAIPVFISIVYKYKLKDIHGKN